MPTTAQAGRRGKDIRSDCWMELSLSDTGGISIDLASKVNALYGCSIRRLVEDVLACFDIPHARVIMEDSGALPYTIAARIETAVKRLRPDEHREYLLPVEASAVAAGVDAPSARDRFRRSRLYLPGNDPKLAINAGIHQPDGVILDLEDSVAATEKDAARILVRNTLRAVDFMGAERMVRINQLPLGDDDCAAVIPQKPQLVLIPKCESADQVAGVHAAIRTLLADVDPSWEVHLMPIIESALGALRAYEIACAAPSVVALSVGLEDYTADIGAERTLEGRESQWMRGMVVNAARAAGVQPIDTVFSDVADMDGLLASAREARALGFDGKGCIHPRQIAVVHQAFAPGTKDIERARAIVLAFDDARRRGSAVVSLGTKMIDPPVVKRALRTIDTAVRAGLLPADWKEAVNA